MVLLSQSQIRHCPLAMAGRHPWLTVWLCNTQELLRLSDAIGEVRERGLKLDDVQHLPCYVHVVAEPHSSTTQQSLLVCVICLDHFTSGQMIRALPCCHEYHAGCVDRWLTVCNSITQLPYCFYLPISLISVVKKNYQDQDYLSFDVTAECLPCSLGALLTFMLRCLFCSTGCQ